MTSYARATGSEAEVGLFADHDDGVLVTVWVVPGASRAEVAGRHGDAVKVRVTAPAEGGKANRAVVDLIAGRCAAPCELVAGAGGRRKTILVRGRTREQVASALS